jgi:hypothetical protein
VVEKVQKTLLATPVSQDSYTITTNPDYVAQFAIAYGNRIQLLTRPTFAHHEDGMPICIGSIGDKLGQVFPISIAGSVFTSELTTLFPQGLAASVGITRLHQAPDTIQGPPTILEDGTEEPTAPSLERLHFGTGENDDDNPVIGVLPLCFPLPVGAPFPMEGLNLGEVSEELEAACPAFKLWHHGIAYAIAHNNGMSVTSGGPLFHLPSINANILLSRTIATHVTPDITPLFPGSVHFQTVAMTLAALERQAWLRIGETLPPEDPIITPGAATGLGSPHAIIKEIFDGVAKLQQPKATLTEAEQLSQADQYMRAYCVMCARLETDPDHPGKQIVVVPEPTELLKKITKATSNSTARSHLVEEVAIAALAARQSNDRLQSAATIDRDMIDSAFTSALRTASFMTVAYIRQPDQISRLLNIATFATPISDSIAFQQRVTAESTLLVQELVQEHASKKAKRATDLYCGGDIATRCSLQEMLANFFLVMNLLVDSFPASELWKSLSIHEDHIRSEPGREFFCRFAKQLQVPLNVCADLQDILASFAILGTHASLRDAAASGTPIEPVVYEKVQNHALTISANFGTQIMRGTATGYDHIPPFANHFPQLKITTESSTSNTKTTPKKANSENANSGKGGPTQKQPKNDKTSPSKDSVVDAQTLEANKGKGFLIWTGDGTPPDCSVRVQGPGKKVKSDFVRRSCARALRVASEKIATLCT